MNGPGVPPFHCRSACRNCRRPLHWVDDIGWLHGEAAAYAHEPIACAIPHPVECRHGHGNCPNGWTP